MVTMNKPKVKAITKERVLYAGFGLYVLAAYCLTGTWDYQDAVEKQSVKIEVKGG